MPIRSVAAISMLNRITSQIIIIVTAILAGCSSSQTINLSPSATEDISKVSFTLSLNRASLTTHDFETYRLLPSGLFYECGVFYRGRPETKFQKIVQPGAAKIESAKNLAREVAARYLEGETPKFDQPGDGNGFADPGKVTVTIVDGYKKIELRTSVDWVEQQRSALASLVNRFAQSVRGVPEQPACGQRDFYGIGRASSD